MLKYNLVMDQNSMIGGATPMQGAYGGAVMPPVGGVGTAPSLVAEPPRKTSVGEIVILVIVCLIAAAAIVCAVIFFMKWNELSTNYNTEKDIAVAEAKKAQKDADEANFAEREKTPNTQFTGPSDFGSLSFYYPKTWSVYVSSDGSNNSDYEAYFAPGQVNPLNDEGSRYALRFIIQNEQIADVQREYDTKVKEGEMTSKVFNADSNRITGTKYEGLIEENMRGIVVLIKVNDKTAILQTDAETYRADFEALLTTLRRNSN